MLLRSLFLATTLISDLAIPAAAPAFADADGVRAAAEQMEEAQDAARTAADDGDTDAITSAADDLEAAKDAARAAAND